MDRQLDVLFVNFSDQKSIYQELANKWTAIEPNVWELILAQACRTKGYGCAVLDADVLKLTVEKAAERIKGENARFNLFVSMGQQPNSSTICFGGNSKLAKKLKEICPKAKIGFWGTHVQALPKEVLSNDFCDIVFVNEGVKPLIKLLETDLETDLHLVKGIGYKENGIPKLNDSVGTLVKQEEMDEWMPGMAIDLLPYDKKPLDLYRSHVWLGDFKEENRRPYFAPYSSLGCFARCSYCIINSINREDISDGVHAGSNPLMRYWSPQLIVRELDKLANLGVKTIFWKDEMMIYNRKHFIPLFELMIERFGDYFHQFAYSRINTIKEEYLDLLNRVGIKWIGFGIESANQQIRQEVTKGHFKDVDIRDILGKVKKSGINSINNFILGLGHETEETAKETIDLAIELQGEFTNLYTAMPLPGSYDYIKAKEDGLDMPKNPQEYSFFSYECKPVPTEKLSSADIVRIRDDGWQKIHSNPDYLSMVDRKFGNEARNNIEELSKIKLRRKLLEPSV